MSEEGVSLMDRRSNDKSYSSGSKIGNDGRQIESGYLYSIKDLDEMMYHKDPKVLRSRFGGLQTVAKELKTDLKSGLEGSDIPQRRALFGENRNPDPEPVSWFTLFFEAFEDIPVRILTVAAIIALVAGILEQFLLTSGGGEAHNSWIEGVAIILAVLIVATVTATNDYLKDKQFRGLKAASAPRTIRVIRNGEEHAICIFDIVVGDIVLLFRGDQIPCDGLFIPGLEELRVDESSLTGEPDAQVKSEANPFLFSGCFLLKGSGRMLVTAVGVNSQWGKTMALMNPEDENTPLQDKLDDLVLKIGYAGMAVAGVVFVVLVGYYINRFVVHPMDVVPCSFTPVSPNETDCNNGTAIPDRPGFVLVPGPFRVESLLDILTAFIIAITIVVVAVPEGLPLAVTISLAYSVQLMMADQNLVRHLAACETMGGATNICSDKTGTLTENRMAVVEGWFTGVQATTQQLINNRLPKNVENLLLESCILNNDDGVLENLPGGEIKFLGNTTECALLVFTQKLGADYRQIQASMTPAMKWGFTSSRKRMSSIYKMGEFHRLFCKGAAEKVLANCTQMLKADGSVEILQPDIRKRMNDNISDLARKGLRTLCFAFRDFEGTPDWSQSENGEGFEEDLVCIATIAIEDPIRQEVPDAVRQCQRAGITVRMVTGDNILTAKKIAAECNIYTEGGVAIEGPDFEKLTDDELERILPNLQVLARSSPENKHTLVKKLVDMGEVVAVTGDGTNDGPALIAADVGFAMGITGTEVAKEAADVIILDDNFASIVKSVMWGRCVYDNIRKFLQFQLTVNVVALTLATIGAVSDYGTPLTAVQLLWVNLIMDTMAALALGTEKPTDRLLLRKPYGREGKLITPVMIRNILGQSALQLGILFMILYAFDANGKSLIFPGVMSGQESDREGKPSVHYTMVFNTFVFLQVFNEINSRKVDLQKNVFSGIFTNWIFVGVVAITCIVQVIIVEVGGQAIRTMPLSWTLWLYCVGLGFLSLPWGFLLRLIPVPLEEWEKEYESF